MALQPLTAQLHIIEGVVQPQRAVPGLYAYTTPNTAARGREKDVLFLHISLGGPLDEVSSLLDELVQIAVRTFHQASGGATAALRQAILAANNHLAKLNRDNKVKRIGSLSAAVLRDDELYMAQVGESYAFIGHNFGLEPLPTEKPVELTPLGQQSGLDIRYFHNWLQAGDMLMLSDPRIAHLESQRFVPGLVDSDLSYAKRMLPEILTRQSARLLLIEFSDEVRRPSFGGEPLALAEPPKRRTQEPADDERLPVLPVRDLPKQPAAEPVKDRWADEIPPNPAAFVPVIEDARAEELSAENDPILPPVNDPHDWTIHDEYEQQQADIEEAEEDLLNVAADEARPLVPIHDQHYLESSGVNQVIEGNGRLEPAQTDAADEPAKGADLQRTTRRAAAGVLSGLSGLLQHLAKLLTRFREPEYDQAAPRGERFYMLLIALITPVLITLIVSGVYLQSRERSQIATIRRDLNLTINEAVLQEPENPDRARILYLDVLAQADRALNIIEDNGDIVAVSQQARDAIDRMDNIVRLRARTLYSYPDSTDLTALAIGTDSAQQRHIFVLDGNNSAVDDHAADAEYLNLIGEPSRLVEAGQGVQRDIVGNVIDIDWKPITANVDESLVILDEQGFAISHFPVAGDTLSSPLGLAGNWESPTSLTSYLGRLYVLDKGGGTGQMWRYWPDGRGFSINEDSRSLLLPDLDKAIDAIIDPDDASVLVLYEDGRIRRYRNDRVIWDEQTLAERGLNEPFVRPTAIKIAGTGPLASVYVLDAGSNRLVEISRAGKVLNQYRVDLDDGSRDLFARTTDFFVLQRPLRIVLVAENVIAVAEK